MNSNHYHSNVSLSKMISPNSLLNHSSIGGGCSEILHNSRKASGCLIPFRSDSTSTVDSVNDIAMENNAMKRQLFKTKICRHNLIGRCKYNDSCFFAHSSDQVVRRIDFRRTKLCSKSNCHDQNCLYAHNIDEVRDPYAPMCPEWETFGKCPNGNACMLSHNLTHVEELALSNSSQAAKTAAASVALSSKRFGVQNSTASGLLSTSSAGMGYHQTTASSSPNNSDSSLMTSVESMSCGILTPPPPYELSQGGQVLESVKAANFTSSRDIHLSSTPSSPDVLLSAEELVQALVQMLSTATGGSSASSVNAASDISCNGGVLI